MIDEFHHRVQQILDEYEEEIKKLVACNDVMRKDNNRIRIELASMNEPEFFKEEEFNVS